MPCGEVRKKKKYKSYKKGGSRRSSLTISGTPRYIKYLSEHLKEEHPSTKKRMKVKK